MIKPILTLNSASVYQGDKWLFKNIDIQIYPKAKTLLIGQNGSGKTTLLNIIFGNIDLDQGQRWIKPHLKISFLKQNFKIEIGQTLSDYTSLNKTHINENYRMEKEWNKLGFTGDEILQNLSGGELRRALLASSLVGNPDLLILDEPTNHLDLPTIEWLEDKIIKYEGSILLVSHDRRFMENIGKSLIWINNQTITSSNIGFKFFEEWSDKINAEEQEKISKLDKRILSENNWALSGIPARRKRNQGRLKELEKLRKERLKSLDIKANNIKILTGESSLSGQLVLEIKNIFYSVSDLKNGQRNIINNFSLLMKKGERIGLIGPNGIGKSSLLKLINREIEPSKGFIKTGGKVEIAYFDQNREILKDGETPISILCPNGGDTVKINGHTKHVVSYLNDFLFSKKSCLTRVSSLSGGEQSRLLLAKTFTGNHNFLILDEPTNDLDIETLEVLQEAISHYNGTLIIASHDRDFLDKTVTNILSFEKEGIIEKYTGGYSDFIIQRKNLKPYIKIDISKKKSARKSSENSINKLSFKQEYELKELSKLINYKEQKILRIKTSLEDPNLYFIDKDNFIKLTSNFQLLETELNKLENRWLELESLREDIKK